MDEVVVDELESESLSRTLGYYAAAVAEALLRDGLSVRIDEVRGHGIVDDKDPDDEGMLVEVFQEAQAVLHLGRAFTAQAVPGRPSLGWDGQSGWYFFVDSDDRLPSESVIGARWLGDGLVPEPARVAAFASVLMLDSTTAGSGERPYYRDPGADVAALISRLGHYLPDHVGAGDQPWRSHFAHFRDWHFTRRALTNLTADDHDAQITLRAGELRTIVDLLKLYEMHDPALLGGIGYHLAVDLERRQVTGAPPQSTDSARRHAADIRAQLEQTKARRRLRDQEEHRED
ncbi:DUF6292 family protein [Kitasatospora sp. NPDC094028]